MTIKHCPILNQYEQEQIWKLVKQSNHEFVPPLSSRKSSTQTELNPDQNSLSQPTKYFQQLLRQKFIISTSDRNEIQGFMSYKTDMDLFRDLNLSSLSPNTPTLYVTTIIVIPNQRGKGITSQMYDHLITIGNEQSKTVSTRTWSTNTNHIKVVQKKNFRIIHRIPNNRGKNIDTIYLEREIQ